MSTVARRIVRQGFAHADLEPAFKAEIEQTEEDLGIEGHASRPILEKVLQVISVSSTIVAAGSLGMTLFGNARWLGPRAYFTWLGPTLFASTVVALGAGFLLGSYAQQQRDVDTRFWSRLWKGPMGRAAFALGARFAGSQARVTAMTHRATELSIGLAAEQLFESLPKDVRKQLAEVPALVSRLQRDVQMLRRQQEDLQELTSGEPSEENLGLRATAHAKLTAAVGALETIRLDLLRLHAGSTTVQSVTTHMGLAEDVSREINRMIAANSDVDRLLAFPSLATPTPV
jgi:serine/threonine-protein kinase